MALDTNLVSSWQFEGNSNDSKGTNHGTDTNITYSSTSGKLGQYASFNGSSSFIALPALGSFTTFSIEFWINTTQSTAGQNFNMGNAAGNAVFNTNLNDVAGKFGIFLWNGSTTTKLNSSKSINDGAWHHIVFTRNGANGKIYIDGYLDSSTSSLHTITIVSEASYTFFGKHPSNVQYYNGKQDAFNLWNIEITSDAVAKLHNARRGNAYPFTDDIKTALAAYYTLNTNANDSFGAVNGTETSIDHVAGKVNNCAEINANSDRISIADAEELKFKYAHTLAMWVNFGGVNRASLDQLFFKGVDGTDFASITVRFSNANTIVYGINANRTTDTRVECSATITVDSNWHLMIAEYDESTIKIYWDNTQIATANTTIAIDTTDPWYLGNTNSTRAVSKKMDEVGMWSRALTSTERTYLWNSGNGRDLFAVVAQALTATTALTSSFIKGVSKTLSSTASITASVRKQMAKTLQATTAITASVIKQMAKALTSTVSVTGVLNASRVFLKAMTATVAITADLSTIQAKILNSVASITSTITKTSARVRTITANVAVTGSMTKGIARTLTSTVVVAATISRSILKTLTATVQTSAIICILRIRVMTATTTITSTLTAKRAVIMNATVAITATTGKQVGKLLRVVLTITAKVIAPFWKTKYPAHGDGNDYEIKY